MESIASLRHTVDDLLERNARLVVRLGQVQSMVHRLEKHPGLAHRCVDPVCLRTYSIIEKNER